MALGPNTAPRRGRGKGADPPPPGHRGNHRPHLLPVHRHSPSDHSCWIRNTRCWKWEMATRCPAPHPVSSPQLSHHFGNKEPGAGGTVTLPPSKTPVRESLPGARRGGKLGQGHTAGLRGSLHPPPTSYLRRFPVGLRPQMPQKAEGKRMLPPMSVPKPSGEPPAAMRAPSPPEEPPGLLEEFHGFMVGPKRGLLQSKLEEVGRGQPLSCWYRCPCPPPCTPGTQPEHGLGDIGVHEGQSALQLQHLHHHTVTLRWHPLVQAQAQCRVLALEGRMGERDMVDVPGGLQHTGSAPTTAPQAKAGHTCSALSRPLALGLPLRAQGDPGPRAGWQGLGQGAPYS